jgi:hypothetical protein
MLLLSVSVVLYLNGANAVLPSTSSGGRNDMAPLFRLTATERRLWLFGGFGGILVFGVYLLHFIRRRGGKDGLRRQATALMYGCKTPPVNNARHLVAF